MTPRQRDVLGYLRSYIAEHDCCPSYQEIGDGVGMKSKSEVHRVIIALAERGHIVRLRDRARAIEIVDQESPALAAARKAGFDDGFSQGYRAGLRDRRAA